MATKPKGRIAPRIDESQLAETLTQQAAAGAISSAVASGTALPPLMSPRGQPVTLDECVLRAVTLADPGAQRVRMRDVRIESSDLANIDLTGSMLERVEFHATRLTGATCTEAHWKSVLFKDCRMDLALLRMARLEHCVFEGCSLVEADFYGADLPGAILRDCDLSRSEISQAKLAAADIRGSRIDGMRGAPATTQGLVISPDQAALLITLFGVRVVW